MNVIVIVSTDSTTHIPMVKVLLDAGASVDNANYDNWTPLYHAAWVGHVEVIKLLLAAGADVNRTVTVGCVCGMV